jgi:pyruvate/2-oxoglutarate/acetoin dehydrogenase E1 component
MSRYREITFAEAINEAIREEMKNDSTVILMGEDVGVLGGPYGVLKGLQDEFGPERVRDTPISEDGFVGAGIGAAITGLNPIVEVMYPDFLPSAMNQIVNHAAKLRYMTGGQLTVSLTIRTAIIQGRGSGANHAQVLIPWFAHVPGLKVVIPSTPYDAKGLLKTAIRDNSPVMFFETEKLYSTRGAVPEEEFLIPFGKADIKKDGSDLTIVAICDMVFEALEAAKELEKEGINAEVIDPRTLVPLDKEAIINSVKKTNKLVIVDNNWRTCGIAAEIAAIVVEEAFNHLDAPIIRVTTPQIPEPVSPPLIELLIPNKEKIVTAAKKLF